METDQVSMARVNPKVINFSEFEKTNYFINNEFDIYIDVKRGFPIVRTENHFTQYKISKRIHIPKGTKFSIYCGRGYLMDIEVDELAWSKNEIVQEEFLNKQYIGIGAIRQGYERIKIDKVFKDYYNRFGYEIITADTDQENFSRSVFRNVLATVFPNEVMIILDGDAFYTKEQLNNAVKHAAAYDKIVKPTDRFLQVEYFENFDPYELRKKFDEVNLNELELHYGPGKSYDGHNYMYYGWYTGLAWVLKPKLWLGMDERCVGWGHEDIVFCYCAQIIDDMLVKLDNGYTLTINHPRDITKEHNTSIGNEWYEKSDKESLMVMLNQYAQYPCGGQFAKLPYFLV
jgi:hypothetical protein